MSVYRDVVTDDALAAQLRHVSVDLEDTTLTMNKRFRDFCAENDLAVPDDDIVHAIVTAAQQVQLLHRQAATYLPDILDSDLVFDGFLLWCMDPPSSMYTAPPDDVTPNPLAAATQQ
jgi:hypothetical protein